MESTDIISIIGFRLAEISNLLSKYIIIMNGFQELIKMKKIDITDTFYVVNILHDIKWAIYIKHILLNLGVTKIIFSQKHTVRCKFEKN